MGVQFLPNEHILTPSRGDIDTGMQNLCETIKQLATVKILTEHNRPQKKEIAN